MKMQLNFRTLAIITALCSAVSCTKSKPPSPVVARFGDSLITADEFRTRAARLLKTGYHSLDTLDMDAKRRILHDIITQRLILMEARKRGLDRDSLIADKVGRIEQRALIETLYARQATKPRYEFTEDEIRKFYHDHGYDTQVLTEQIVCTTEDSARQALAELRSGKTFPELVPKYTIPYVQRRFGSTGNIGWFFMADMLPAPRAPLQHMKVGDLCPEPVHSRLGYNVFRLNGRRSVPLDSVRTLILKKLDARRREQDRLAYDNELRQRYHLQVHMDALEALHALPGNVKVWPGRDKPLYTWKGGQLTCADYMALHRLGRVRHPSSYDLDGLHKLVDNLAGQQVMKDEARKLGYDKIEAIRTRVQHKRDQLLAEKMYRLEGELKALPVTAAQVDSYLHTRKDTPLDANGNPVPGSLRYARRHLRRMAAEKAMDTFIDSLRKSYQNRIQVYNDVLAGIQLERKR